MGPWDRTCRAQLEAELGAARVNYEKLNPLSKASHETACKYLPGGNTRTVLYTSPFPLSIASGRSCYLTTKDGRTYVDFLNEYTAGIYGHSHPDIRQAIEEALDLGWNYGGHCDREAILASLICTRYPPIEQVRFVNSGTEANMMALATALAYTGKRKVLLFAKGYHGSTIVGRAPSQAASINLPHEFLFGRYNDVDGTKNLVASLPEGSLAAILVEPMLGSGGCYAASQTFLTTLRTLATTHGALLIFDEVMTSRLAYGGLGATMNVTPDLMTLGKYVGGGMSFGAFGGRTDIMSLYDPRSHQLEHPGTFNNNVFSMTAGIAGLKLLNADTLTRLNALGQTMQTKLTNILSQYGIEGNLPSAPDDDASDPFEGTDKPPKMFVNGIGSLLCVHFAGPERDLLQGLFFHFMLDQGYYHAPRGFIALCIETKIEHVDGFADAVSQFCQRYQPHLLW